jgi:hypothetical protein
MPGNIVLFSPRRMIALSGALCNLIAAESVLYNSKWTLEHDREVEPKANPFFIGCLQPNVMMAASGQ